MPPQTISFFCASYPQRKHYSLFLPPTTNLLQKHFTCFGGSAFSWTDPWSAASLQSTNRRAQLIPCFPLLSVCAHSGGSPKGCEVTRSTKRSHWDCPSHVSTQRATNQSPSGHINTAVNISAAEDFRIKFHLFLSCYRPQHRKIAGIFSNLRSIQLAFGLAHYLKGRGELSLPVTGCEAPWSSPSDSEINSATFLHWNYSFFSSSWLWHRYYPAPCKNTCGAWRRKFSLFHKPLAASAHGKHSAVLTPPHHPFHVLLGGS